MTSPLSRGGFLKTLKEGQLTIGTFLGLASPLAAEVAALSGVDWVLLDLEHGGGGEEQVSPTVVASGGYGVPTLVRVESAERIRIGRVLDSGVAGVMIPRVDTVEQVELAVRHMSYPPNGDRGVATYNRAVAWGKDLDALAPEPKSALLVQIETLGALAEVEKIAAVPGVDALFVGPLDLSYALGVPRDFKNPKFLEALKKVLAAANAQNKVAGILASDTTIARFYVEMGFKFIAIGSDSTLMAKAITDAVDEIRK
ncbi:MAG: 2,4-dihydroxyhept-2-ene-1,7-dioic acid aldolase [Rhodoluna sp.]|jgi:4-hydroxy-2-oxoheptanedioate aldolase|nr:2,4-dihydroxyhept-2-ene-1,7-dioic acid aldolase [Rhodoluna sp.]MBP7818576.1 2,4-dihydroxyhept-2-ene-1,7-dioic acid aldolase [Rhodoluna sp.]